MRHLRQHQVETAEQWLNRLHATDSTALPPHDRRTLFLSIGYARYLIEKGQPDFPASEGADCPLILPAQS